MSLRHIGTIVFGSMLAWIPESLNIVAHKCEEKCECCYNVFCCFYSCFCESLSKYCYVGTIMYSQDFMEASRSMGNARATAKHIFPELYMVGNFFITFMKVFIVLANLVICYFVLTVGDDAEKYREMLNLVGPLVVPHVKCRLFGW